MSDFPFKKRRQRAIRRAMNILDNPPGRYQIIRLKGDPFHIEAMGDKEILKIRICIDEISDREDVQPVKNFVLPEFRQDVSRQIWIKKKNQRNFELMNLN